MRLRGERKPCWYAALTVWRTSVRTDCCRVIVRVTGRSGLNAVTSNDASPSHASALRICAISGEQCRPSRFVPVATSRFGRSVRPIIGSVSDDVGRQPKFTAASSAR